MANETYTFEVAGHTIECAGTYDKGEPELRLHPGSPPGFAVEQVWLITNQRALDGDQRALRIDITGLVEELFGFDVLDAKCLEARHA